MGLSDSKDKEDMFTILQREGEGERAEKKKDPGHISRCKPHRNVLRSVPLRAGTGWPGAGGSRGGEVGSSF